MDSVLCTEIFRVKTIHRAEQKSLFCIVTLLPVMKLKPTLVLHETAYTMYINDNNKNRQKIQNVREKSMFGISLLSSSKSR